MRRTLQITLALLAAATMLLGATVSTDASGSKTTYMKVKPAHSNLKVHHTSNLSYHGGPVEQGASVFIVWWGVQWQNGFATGSYTSAQAQTYVTDFFSNVGGSSWARSTTQYCSGVAAGTTQCGTSGTHASLSTNVGGTWNDTSNAVPTSPTQTQIQNEAGVAAAHFGVSGPNADIMVFTPTGHSQSGFGTNFCAYHSASGSLSYSYVPFQPDAGASCGMNFVNGVDNAYGNGYFDGFSIVAGHEYGETVTDPQPNSGWLDSRAAENGDKCAWISSGQGAASNISLGSAGNFYAVQSLWSNAFNGGAGGCVLTYP